MLNILPADHTSVKENACPVYLLKTSKNRGFRPKLSLL